MLKKIKIVYKRFQAGLLHMKTKLKIKQLDQHPVLQVIMFSILINLVIEMFSRRSFMRGLKLIITNPLMFLFNMLIILFTLSITLMFSRKKFLVFLISFVWLMLGVVNFILLGYRTTPLQAIDFNMLESVFGFISLYLSIFQAILIVLGVAVFILIMICLWRKLPKEHAQGRVSLTLLFSTATLLVVISSFSSKANTQSGHFGNIADAYSEYGFVYCFSLSLFDRGMEEPEAYSEENMEVVLETIDNESDATSIKDKGILPIESMNESENKLPANIIMVQLESFFDVNYLKDFTFSENPIPNFTHLKKTYSSGFLTVPSIGSGTANTEFEILTGMNIKYFGAGEYPYKTILQNTTCESISYNLRELGYYSHAIHNNTGTFYDRHKIFQKLGFDSYSSIEYMNNVDFNPLGWAKDKVLTAEILKGLDASEKQDFIYAISVQPHGKYPDKKIDEDQKIQLVLDEDHNLQADKSVETYDPQEKEKKKIKIDDSFKNKVAYFINQLAETDQFIGELTQKLSGYREPTIVVFFGDHLPPLSFEDDDLVNNNRFQTEYVLWSNFQMEKIERDLNAYQLNAYIMERLGYDRGILTKFHQKNIGQPNYYKELELLQYDMLYGEKKVFEGQNPYVEKPLQMGVYEVVITSVQQKGEGIFIEGKHFTPWSVVYIEGKPKETLYIDEHTLIVPLKDFDNGKLFVAQENDDHIILSKSREWIVEEVDESFIE